MSQPNSYPRSSSTGRRSPARVIPLRLCTEPPAAIPPVADEADEGFFVRVQVQYDVEAIAQVIAPILDYDASILGRALRAGPVIDGPHPHAEAVALASALGHFGVSCAFESVQSLGRLPAMPATNSANPAGRYVYGATQSAAGRNPQSGKTGIGR